MSVISIAITTSIEEIVAGVPRSVTIETNIPSTIFYTLDGTDPTLSSSIYVGALVMPSLVSVTLRVFATNGTDSSPIIEEIYTTNELNNARISHSTTDVSSGTNVSDLYPFGTNPLQPNGTYLNPANAAVTVDNPDKTEISSGFDGTGTNTSAGSTNDPYTLENYSIIYSTTDAEGQRGNNVGNLPANVTVLNTPPPPEELNTGYQLIDPRAMVIFHDVSKEDPSDPPLINRMHFTLEDPEKARDGNSFYNSGPDSPPTNGTFLRSHFNPRDNTITYYYLDTTVNKWIISKMPFNPNSFAPQNMSGIIDTRSFGSKYVYEWQMYPRRVLF